MKISFFRTVILGLLVILSLNTVAQQSRYLHLIIGTYTKSQNNGIFVYQFDTETGKLSFISKAEDIQNPSFLVLSNDGSKIYSVNENDKGKVSAFNFDGKTGQIKFLNTQETKGAHPCHVTLTKDGKFLIASNYSSGSLSIFPILEDGSLAPMAQKIQHTGKSVDPTGRQESAHAHSTIISPDGNYLYAADLGVDKIYGYKYSEVAEQPFLPAEQPYTNSKPGTGPRHMTFSKKGDFLYSVEELSGTVAIYSYKNNKLTEIQRASMNADDFKGENGAADIHLSNDQKFLYATNRGSADEITIFSVDATSGKLQKVGVQSTLGKHPRNFIIDPSDRFLLIANQNTDEVLVFERNSETGLLKFTGEKISVGAPVCLKFAANN